MLHLPLSLRAICGKNGNSIYLPLKWGKKCLQLSLTNVLFITLHTHTYLTEDLWLVPWHSKFKEGMATFLVAQTVKKPPAMGRLRFDLWFKMIPWRREWPSTPVFLPGKSHVQKSLESYRPWDCKQLDTTE